MLAILCCPVTHKGLVLANAEQLRRINAAIASGKVENQEGEVLRDALREALVTDDGKRLYPVNDGIPLLLEGEAVLLDHLEAA